jgi:hypothetical protein
MKQTSLTLLVILFSCALIGCKKKAEPVKNAPSQQTTERVSGTHAAIDIVWEDSDLK